MGAAGAETAERGLPGGNGYVGRALKRKEDPRLITGRATYVDDLVLPGTLYAAIVRSPEAHARIASIDVSAAAAREGIEAVFTGEDMDDLAAPCPMVWVPPGVEVHVPDHWPLARGKVGYVGQAVAVVLGSDKYAVVDAAEEVLVDYEPLPVVVDPEAALRDGAPIIHEQFGTNQVFEWELAGGDVDAAFAEADVVMERRVVNHRTAGAAIEPRGALAEWREDHLTLWSSTQIPHVARVILSIELGIPEERIRVVAPEVGGGFGSKLQVYGEETLTAWCARKTGRPVKWTATRSDDMLTTHHGRDQIDYVRIAATREGELKAIDVRVIQDCGSYHLIEGPVIPTFTSCVVSGVYDFDAVRTTIVGVFTNKVTTDAIRGAGRPEATHLIEVCIDQLADELGIDRLELRRRNFIRDFPNERPHGFVYDSGDYDGTLDKCLELLDLDGFRREQEQLRSDPDRPVYRGVGFSTYVEICGLGPSRALGPDGWGMQGGYFESAQVRVLPTGGVMVYTGTSPHGQGLETSMAQIVADRLGLAPDAVEVIHGDTNTGPFGKDTYGSRSLSVGGEAVARAAEKVQDKAKRIVAHKLEAAPEDIEVAEGVFRVKGSPEQSMTLAEVATEAYIPADLPEGLEAGLDEISFYDPDNFVWPFGAHACVVEVDAETGRVEIVRWIAVDDCGPAINPKLIDGQVHGGAVHAIGQALYERIHYDEAGQLVTGTFVDYGLPTAAEVPSFETARTETRSPTNTLGVKGVGEAATIAASPAIVNAVIDALRPLGVRYIDMPLTSERVWNAIQEAKR
ncbi:xanthine dehydrogenase family protein molybdopterin-binding subunit [Conexibacter arvalis]|uniref:Carbon-monoxide dehydrogenase large subunit n=1 Tax=Conexibacter arvalis TaxID=912552 RepID=A0A840ILR6_9ACTN|nr:xanthine dehydrogenase family protein molybdopterin-binding subunit [Conexibacter arvalis]MBB4664878.1 carbon-monoxide dehydrogenase large subunit [Conexibacter arvalis]